ncbi:hypothetical protein BH09PSE2_BH09PSE2_26250 [soil metagenome]
MKQAELAHYRALLLAQASEPERRGLFGGRSRAIPAPRLVVAGDTHAPPPPRPGASRFGRRPVEVDVVAETPLLLTTPAPEPPVMRLRLSPDRHLAETPFHAEDLADPHPPAGPRPGVIAGWSTVKPPSAQTRLLRRVGCVIEAERQGLNARLAEAGV